MNAPFTRSQSVDAYMGSMLGEGDPYSTSATSSTTAPGHLTSTISGLELTSSTSGFGVSNFLSEYENFSLDEQQVMAIMASPTQFGFPALGKEDKIVGFYQVDELT